MNQNEENPDNLGGLGDMLPADVLKLVNELLEQLHRKEKDHQGSIVLNIYGKGSMHIDRVDNQYFYGDKWAKALQNRGAADGQQTADPVFEKDTPLSALFRESHLEGLKRIIESWRPSLIEADNEVDALQLSTFHFDFSQIRPATVYLDFAHLINHEALQSPMSVLAAYMYQHSNLSKSENALYVQLKRYKKLCE